MRIPSVTAVAVSALFLAGLAAAESGTTPETLAQTYLNAVFQNNWHEAETLWLPSDLAAAQALGITYDKQPLKLDSASLIVLERARVQSGEIAVSIGEIIEHGPLAEIQFRLQAGDQTATTNYYAVRSENTWRFTSPATARSAGWEQRETEFLDLRIQPPRVMPQEAINLLDQFVGETCKRLGVSPERVELLRTHKLRYYLGDEETVTAIVGAPTRGAALLQTDAVITSELCHLHELAHLLVNFALQDLPLYTLPILQEGTAVALGGRWGRTSEVMQGLGKYTLQSGMLSLDELLTWDDFHGQSADWTYAPSGIVAGFLLDELGGERFLELYRQLSGDLADLQRLDRAMIQATVSSVAEMEWPALHRGLSAYLEELSCGGVLPAGDCDAEPVATLHVEGAVATARRDGDQVHWEVGSDDPEARYAVLFREPDPQATHLSRLFTEQFPDRDYDGESMAMVLAPGEIGLYDFRTDLLLAKYVESFCPEQHLATDDGAKLRFKIRGDLLPGEPWDAELVMIRR